MKTKRFFIITILLMSLFLIGKTIAQTTPLNQQTSDYLYRVSGSTKTTKIWGSDSSNMYFVGDNGLIVHYNGSSWTTIESGTNLDIVDIYGATNNNTGKTEILAIASKLFSSYERKILRLTGTTINELSDSAIIYPLSSVWFIPNKQYYVAGDGIYEKKKLSESQWRNKALDITKYYTYSVRGNDVNDVIAIGAYGNIVHYNGKTWKEYTDGRLSSGNYIAVSIRGNVAMTTGYNGQQAVIAVGRR
jgi:hypothetical protein